MTEPRQIPDPRELADQLEFLLSKGAVTPVLNRDEAALVVAALRETERLRDALKSIAYYDGPLNAIEAARSWHTASAALRDAASPARGRGVTERTAAGRTLVASCATMAVLLREYSADADNPNISSWLRGAVPELVERIELEAHGACGLDVELLVRAVTNVGVGNGRISPVAGRFHAGRYAAEYAALRDAAPQREGEE